MTRPTSHSPKCWMRHCSRAIAVLRQRPAVTRASSWFEGENARAIAAHACLCWSASLEQHFALVVERETPFALLCEPLPLRRDFEQLRVRLVAEILGQHAAFFRITTIGKTFLHLYPADVKTVTERGYGV